MMGLLLFRSRSTLKDMNPVASNRSRKNGPITLNKISAALVLIFGAAAGFGATAASAPATLLLVANKSDQTLGLIDPVAGKQIAAISEDGITGHEVVASVDGKRAFVPIYGNAGVGHLGTDGSIIRVIDLEKQAIAATIDLGKGVRPHCARIGPKDGLLYVTTELLEFVTVIDPATLKILRSIPTGQKESHMLAITSDGKRGYTANVAPGTVSVLDLENGKLLKVIPVAPHTQRISLSADDRHAFTTDQTVPRVAVIDTATNEVSSSIKLPGIGFSTAPTPDGHSLLVTLPSMNLVAVIDLQKGEVVHTLSLPRAPQEILIRPDGEVAYVSCDVSRQVGVIDLKKWAVSQLVDAGPGADGLAWAVRR